MSKPEDIPQDVWNAANIAAAGRLPLTASHGEAGDAVFAWAVNLIARAIISAKAEEREACAEVTDVLADAADFAALQTNDPNAVTQLRAEERALICAAGVIRERGVSQ